MNEFTPLSKPLQSTLKVDPVAKECPSEGFNFPTFRLLNKQARVYLSPSLNPHISTPYQLLSVANSKGWFAAVKSVPSGSDVILSPLVDLRSAFTKAKADDELLFVPKRSLSFSTKANIVQFTCSDTRLLIALEDGSVIAYETSLILTPGVNDVPPLNRIQIQSSPLRQIIPNPSSEQGLYDLFAVVGDGIVQLFNNAFESQGGWAASDLMSQPIAVDWSPKGKHIAFGLQTGDILTFSPTNKSTPHKHIPPTVNSILVSLNWLGPGHTFRTSYAAQGDISATQHIVSLDAKTSSVSYFAPDHPFPLGDRTSQASYVVNLPKWDADKDSNEDIMSLTVVGDISSVDLEVLGNAGNQWYRQYQENQLTLPLDKSMEDTILLALELDLTDSTAAQPVMYAYLNDGSVQAWNVDHSKPYLGMAAPNVPAFTTSASEMAVENKESVKDADMGNPASEIVSMPPAPAPSAFGQSSFGQSSQPLLGGLKASTSEHTGFGQTSSSPFQSSFGQTSGIFGQPSPSTTLTTPSNLRDGFGTFASTGNAFASDSSANAFGTGSFGTSNVNPSPSESTPMVREASMSDATPTLGGMSLGGTHPSNPSAANSMFGSFSSTIVNESKDTTSIGESFVKPATGFGAFGGFKSTGAFDTSRSSGFKASTPTFAFGGSSQPPAMSSGFGQSGFSSPAFGKPSFGQPAFGKTSLGASTTPSVSPGAFGLSGPSSGFGAFASVTPVFGLNRTDTNEAPTSITDIKPKTSIFGTPKTSQSEGGSDKKTSDLPIGDMESPPGSPIKPSAPSPPSSPEPVFGKIMSTPSSTPAPAFASGSAFANIQTTPSAFKPATGFGAFGGTSASTSSPFFKKSEEKPSVFPAFLAASSSPAKSPSAPGSAFGSTSVLGSSIPAFTPAVKAAPTTAPTTGGFSAFGGTSTGFGAFTGQRTSFSDLLKTGGAEAKDVITHDAFAPAKETVTESPKNSGSVFGNLTTNEDKSSGALSAPSRQVAPKERQKTEESGAKEDYEKVEKVEQDAHEKSVQRDASTATVSDETSYATISASSAASSFVEVGREKEDSVALKEEEEEENLSDEDAEHSGDDGDSFLSDNLSDTSYKDGDSANDDDEEYLREESTSPSKALPSLSRSPTATPQDIRVVEMPSLTLTEDTMSPSKIPPAREQSTTPPNTPTKDTKSISETISTSASPNAHSPSPGPSGFGFGLGRPSTRPMRSSPLANAVVPADEEEDKVKSPPKPTTSVIPSESNPDALPAVTDLKDEDTQVLSNKRPKTPPLLSTMAPVPSTPILAPAIPPNLTKSTSASSDAFSVGPRPVSSTLTPKPSGGMSEKKGENNLSLAPNFSMPGLTRPATTPPASGLTSLFGVAPPPPTSSLPPFTLNNGKNFPVFGESGIFGAAKSPLSPFTSQGVPGIKTSSPPPLPFGGPLGQKSAMTTQSVFGTFPATQPPTGNHTIWDAQPTAAKLSRLSPENTLEEGMQKECAHLINILENEFAELRKVAQESLAKLREAGRHSVGDLQTMVKPEGVSTWNLGDLKYFNQILIQCQADLEELSSYQAKETQMLRELQSNILKAVTRKEEIARFNKAKNDKEFARILKTRSLGPEYSETQSNLRRSIRNIRDRVQKLESRLQESKKRLAHAASRKPTMRPPTLDTINRTYRNIELSIDQQSEDVARLTSRIAKLRVAEERPNSPISFEDQSPTPGRRRPYNVTPTVAITTAAALNAERSAHRLKKALLSVRKEPLLNTKAVSAPSAPLAFKTPQKVSDKKLFEAQSPAPGPLFGGPATPVPLRTPPTIPLPEWNDLPEDNFNPTGPASLHGRRGATGQKKHQTVPLKRSNGASAPLATPPTDFEWGPLPTFSTSPPSASMPKSFVPFSSVKK